MSKKSVAGFHLTLAEQKDIKAYAFEFECYQSDVISDAIKVLFAIREEFESEITKGNYDGVFEDYLEDRCDIRMREK